MWFLFLMFHCFCSFFFSECLEFFLLLYLSFFHLPVLYFFFFDLFLLLVFSHHETHCDLLTLFFSHLLPSTPPVIITPLLMLSLCLMFMTIIIFTRFRLITSFFLFLSFPNLLLFLPHHQHDVTHLITHDLMMSHKCLYIHLM